MERPRVPLQTTRRGNPGYAHQFRPWTLFGAHTDPGGVNARALFIYSTNHGASWLASPEVNPTIPPQLNENQMVELNSGQIMVCSRAPSGGNGKRVWATYTRGATPGDGTIGLLYETGSGGPYETLTFARFDLDWLTQADVDQDGDGMSDYYESINRLNRDLDDAQDDADGEGAFPLLSSHPSQPRPGSENRPPATRHPRVAEACDAGAPR